MLSVIPEKGKTLNVVPPSYDIHIDVMLHKYHSVYIVSLQLQIFHTVYQNSYDFHVVHP